MPGAQIEGAANADGRGASIWDTFSHTPGKTQGGDTGDVACNFYSRYKEDIALMKSLGVQMFRFSISWSRVLPEGTGKVKSTQQQRRLLTLKGVQLWSQCHSQYGRASNLQVNKAGVDFYNSVIDELIRAGIEPHITLYHWDLPQALEVPSSLPLVL